MKRMLATLLAAAMLVSMSACSSSSSTESSAPGGEPASSEDAAAPEEPPEEDDAAPTADGETIKIGGLAPLTLSLIHIFGPSQSTPTSPPAYWESDISPRL